MDKEKEGRIHSFETFGAVDGPGLRFVIFMQGCHLKCQYCQNRDTWDCSGGKIYTVEELVTKIEKYRSYIIASQGGVTISGGEPLLQPKFLLNLIIELKKRKIHVAIDTSGEIDLTEDIKKIIELTDLFLLDIKSIDTETCKMLTGVSNEKELAFARYLNENKKEVWIRQVLVPGITDKEEDLKRLKEFINSLEYVKKVEILPYHDMGKFKWEKLKVAYPLEGIKTANKQDVDRAYQILEMKKQDNP